MFIELRNDAPLLELRELIAAESECCRWMNLELDESIVPPVLTITADTDEGVSAIVEMITAVR